VETRAALPDVQGQVSDGFPVGAGQALGGTKGTALNEGTDDADLTVKR
jgi:hypothetical protein